MWRLSRFFGIGAVATLGYFVLTNVAVSLYGVGPKTASVGVYLLLMPLSFIAHRWWTFASSGHVVREWVRFCGVHAVNLMIAYEVSSIVAVRDALPPWLAFLIISLVVPAVSFIAFQLWVFTGVSKGVDPRRVS
jgi:putative flippase GtrA